MQWPLSAAIRLTRAEHRDPKPSDESLGRFLGESQGFRGCLWVWGLFLQGSFGLHTADGINPALPMIRNIP